MDVAARVCDDDVELFSIGEEIGGDDFDAVRGFAEEGQLVGFFLFIPTHEQSPLLPLPLKGGERSIPYTPSTTPP